MTFLKMTQNDYNFEGWMALDKDSVDGKMVWQQYEPKSWEETDVDIEITHSGICGSDLHTLRSGWGETLYPMVVGHEIIGKAVRVGSKAEKGIKVGDRVGVGAQSEACNNRKGDCEPCSVKSENYCPGMVTTYDSKHFNGGVSYGGYARYKRCPSRFVFKIPDPIPSPDAAPMLCAGITVYSPLKHWRAGPGKKVGIVGLGGLGHFGVLFAKALGADKVVAISRKAKKRDDALKLGADEYIATDEDKEWSKHNGWSLDLIISTVSSSQTAMSEYMQLLRSDGTLVQVGNPDDGMFNILAGSVIGGRKSFAGSAIGSPTEIDEMLELAAKHQIKPWIQERSMKDANQTIIDMENGQARYRYVLVN